MNQLVLEYYDSKNHVTEKELKKLVDESEIYLSKIDGKEDKHHDSLGWVDVEEWAGDDKLEPILNEAKKVREDGDVFVLIGVGGSNNGAKAVISALQQEGTPEICYAGNNISAHYLNRLINSLDGKSVYINVIAKNFETLEPGIGFRVLRQYIEKRYGESAKERIVVTGTKGSTLYQLAEEKGYNFFEFPENIGGRFSVLSNVGLYPMAVAGIDIASLVQGAKDMRNQLIEQKGKDNLALLYAAYRNILLQKGYEIEMLTFFEPQLQGLSKWWIQLFAESEGKEDKGLFPVASSCSEDLHSVGQYVQDGKKILFETFLDIEEQNSSLVIQADNTKDYFHYLDNVDFWDINKAALDATITAHSEAGIPCLKLTIPKLDEYYMGQLFYLFEFACYLSGTILDINPFDQPGVENYKGYMFKKLGK